MKVIHISVGVNIIGLPIYHAIEVPESKNMEHVVVQNVILKRNVKGYQGPNVKTKNK